MKNLTPEGMLNMMLSNTCAIRSRKSDNLRLFVIDLHCNNVWIVAQFTPNREEETYEYKIIDWKLQNTTSDADMNNWANRNAWDN